MLVLREPWLANGVSDAPGGTMEIEDNTAVSKPMILVVDDAPDSLTLLHALLRDEYKVKVASGGERALTIAYSEPQPDLILLDIMMPGMDGYEVCTRLKADSLTRHIPVMFLTAKSEEADEQRGLDLGAVDYITKPIKGAIVRARVRTQLALKASADFLRDKNVYLEEEVARRTREVMSVQDVTTLAMASLAETRDADTGNHIRRTQRYVRALAWKLCTHPQFAAALTPHDIGLLYKSAPLHDIGKVGIPDRILLKPGKLTPEEFEVMKTHTTLGRDAILNAEKELGVQVEFLTVAKEIAYSHQEKWDGSGYPLGLSGTQIPISARLMAVADVYDALISRRVYKEPMPHALAVEIIAQTRGKHFDPNVVDAFLEIQDAFNAIAIAFSDTQADLELKAQYIKIATVHAD
jgi:putative two-component system response regulator